MYHEAFWVAVAASAPVIALASIVSFTDHIAEWSRYIEFLATHPLKIMTLVWSVKRYMSIGAVLSLVNVVLQGAVLGFSLSSLAAHSSEVSPVIAITAEVVGVVLLTSSALAAVVTRFSRATLVQYLHDNPKAMISKDSG